jgi:hypothetical protein
MASKLISIIEKLYDESQYHENGGKKYIDICSDVWFWLLIDPVLGIVVNNEGNLLLVFVSGSGVWGTVFND